MKIYYQWVPGAYSHIVSNHYKDTLWLSESIWVDSFIDIFNYINKGDLWLIPIENSYAGSIYENFTNLVKNNVKIYSEYFLDIQHSLVAKTDNINNIDKVMSHYQALMQCENYIKLKWWEEEICLDTAYSAKYISENWDMNTAWICSKLAWEIYSLNILDENIQDQLDNTTRFFLVAKDGFEFNLSKSKKTSLIFRTKHIPASLYKCLWVFATRNINLTKIESLPSKDTCFEYMFWIDFDASTEDDYVKEALDELSYFTNYIRVLWAY